MSENNKFAELEAKFEESQRKQDEINQKLMQMLTLMSQSVTSGQSKEEVPSQIEKTKAPKKNFSALKQPRMNEMIQVQSLTHGELCLNVNNNVSLKLERYGAIKPVLYSELVSIVNNNRKFAENGHFYILDERAVYHLGLSNYYENLLSFDEIENIQDYSDDSIRQMLSNTTQAQRNCIVANLTYRAYKNIGINYNKVDVIGKACDVNINEKVSEMRTFDQYLSGRVG